LLGRAHYIADYRGGGSIPSTLSLIESALLGGAGCVQVRSKACTDGESFALAKAAVGLCRGAGAACIVNDRVDIALAAGADGAHIGPDDLPVAQARRILGPGLLLGASARDPGKALEAVAAGADYLGVGPCYLTASKEGLPGPIGPEGLANVAVAVSVPVLAIGGVTAERVPELLRAGAYGVAVIGAIAAAPDPEAAAREIVSAINGALSEAAVQ